MMMIWLVCFTAVGFIVLALAVKRISEMVSDLVRLQESQPRNVNAYRDLTRQVDEIHQTMGGVINSLKAVGNQVYHLNLLAGHALQGSNQQGQQQGDSPQILIELRPAGNREHEEHQGPMSYDEMSPEMQEKFRAFHAVYSTMMDAPNVPSRKHPEMN